MTNSAKTPAGKAKKGQVTVRPDSGSIKACFPRNYFDDGKQLKLGTGILQTDGWEAKANQLQRRLQIELEDGKLATGDGIFNLGRYQEILEEYGLRARLRLVKEASTSSSNQVPPKPELSLLEIWDMYCEYRKQGLRESVYEGTYQGQFLNCIKSAIEATKSENALKIRNWLVENRNIKTVKNVISNLSKAHQLGIKNKLLTYNSYEVMVEEIGKLGARGKTQEEVETDYDVLDQSKAYTWDEAQIILEYIESNRPHWYSFTKFKFLTGCRTGEAIALRWCDIDWGQERILIRNTYNKTTKKFYPLKNDKTYKGEEVRRFPMPKDGELWSLLKSIPQGELGDVVFKSKKGSIIDFAVFGDSWRGKNCPSEKYKGIIPELIRQGKLTKYLSPYNTRHTFINHAIHDLGIPEKHVCYMCGHKPDVSNKHYQDEAIFMKGINPEIPFSQQQFGLQTIDNQKSEIELLREQNEQLRKLLEEMKNHIIT